MILLESFLVFRKAIFTGTYKKDYEGKLDASYDRDQDRYVLGVRQGDSVITLFYQKLELEVNIYNYGEIAHFRVAVSRCRKPWQLGMPVSGGVSENEKAPGIASCVLFSGYPVVRTG